MVTKLPPWFKKKPAPEVISALKGLLDGLKLHTICESALCPNAAECFSRKTATFLILGDICTRNCTFCAVKKGKPEAVDEEEPEHLLQAVESLGLKYVVLTSVTRDDLDDGGASHFARTIRLLKEKMGVMVEVLIPDFLGSDKSLKMVISAHPEVINHNIETVPRLYHEVRPKADYKRSLELLLKVKRLEPEIVTKSGLMLGLGERREEILQVMQDLREVGCELLTLGQYLRPSPKHHPVARFVPPEEFEEYRAIGKKMGFTEVASAPLVRSSFKAAQLYFKARGTLTLDDSEWSCFSHDF